jgi:hypothetical protein
MKSTLVGLSLDDRWVDSLAMVIYTGGAGTPAYISDSSPRRT